MKEFRKIIGIFSGIFAAIGIVLIIAGISMGGIYVIAEDVASGVLSIGPEDFIFGDFEGIDTDKMASVSESGSRFEGIEVDSLEFYGKYGEFEIMSWNETYYEIIPANNSDEVRYNFENGILQVATAGKDFNFWGNNDEVKVKIMVPADDSLEDLLINVGAGEITCANIKGIAKLDVNIGAGEGKFNGIEAMEVNFTVGAGDGDVENSSFTNCVFEVGVGDIDVSGSVNGNVKIDCGIGGVSLDISQTKNEFNYKIDVGLGDVKIGKEKYSGIVDNTNIDNDSDKLIDIECGMGDVKLEFLED